MRVLPSVFDQAQSATHVALSEKITVKLDLDAHKNENTIP